MLLSSLSIIHYPLSIRPKRLDTLILKAFLGPFVATLFLTLFVLILQFFWLYIDDFVGKDIGGFLIARFVLYLSATLVPLALPLIRPPSAAPAGQ